MAYPEDRIETSEKFYSLSQLLVFQDLTKRELDHLYCVSAITYAEAGHIFYYPGDNGETVYLLLEGQVRLYRISLNGRRLLLALLSPGALFDEASLFGDGVHRTFAQSVGRVRTLTIGRTELQHLMFQNPLLTLRLLEMTYPRLHALEGRLASFVFKDITARVAEMLLWLAEEQGSNKIVGLTHQDLAEMVGTYRETITSSFNALKAQGYIDLGRKRIVIFDHTRLTAMT